MITDTTTALTGMMPFVLIIAALLAWPVSFWIIKSYHKSVNTAMSQKASNTSMDSSDKYEFADLSKVKSSLQSYNTDQLYNIVACRPWLLAKVHIIAGAAFAFLLTILKFSADNLEFYPLRFMLIFACYVWPIVFAINVLIPGNNGYRFSFWVYYTIAYLVLCFIGNQLSPDFTIAQGMIMWLVFNFPPTLLLVLFIKSRIRAIGPLVFTFMTVSIFGSILLLNFIGSSDNMMQAAADAGAVFSLSGAGSFFALVIIGVLVFSIGGWFTLGIIKSRYNEKKVNDKQIMLETIWAFFAFYYSMMLAFSGPVWMFIGIISFFICRIIIRIGHNNLMKRFPGEDCVSLLFLRVFSLGKRSEQFFDWISKHWRFAGSIQLISGPDLATSTIEPHELIDYLTGKLSRRFIANSKDIKTRLAEMDNMPDKDGLYRVNDFFCYQNTWQKVLQALVNKSKVVLMDLRGFSAINKGCEYEIRALFNTYPVEKIVFTYDDSSDQQFMKQVLNNAWNEKEPLSVNHNSNFNQVVMFKLNELTDVNFRMLLKKMCSASSEEIKFAQVAERYN